MTPALFTPFAHIPAYPYTLSEIWAIFKDEENVWGNLQTPEVQQLWAKRRAKYTNILYIFFFLILAFALLDIFETVEFRSLEERQTLALNGCLGILFGATYFGLWLYSRGHPESDALCREAIEKVTPLLDCVQGSLLSTSNWLQTHFDAFRSCHEQFIIQLAEIHPELPVLYYLFWFCNLLPFVMIDLRGHFYSLCGNCIHRTWIVVVAAVKARYQLRK